MSVKGFVGAGGGLAIGLGVAGLVTFLLDGTLRPVREIARYVDDIAMSAGGIVGNLEGLTELGRTGELAGALAGLLPPDDGTAQS